MIGLIVICGVSYWCRQGEGDATHVSLYHEHSHESCKYQKRHLVAFAKAEGCVIARWEKEEKDGLVTVVAVLRPCANGVPAGTDLAFLAAKALMAS